MSEPAFLTTKTAQWNRRMPSTPPRWTTRGDGFDLEFSEEEVAPLVYLKHLADNVDSFRCTETEEVVAVKRLPTYSNHNDNEKLKNEVKVLRDLKHYHCIQVLGCYSQDDWFNIVTQPAADCDLKEYLSQGKSKKVEKLEPLCGSRATFLPRTMGCLAYTLYYIHNEPRVRHRDIKPENILLEGPKILFADFGLSKVFTETQSGSSGTSAKTIMYTSPERANNEHRNPKDDIFSLACVLSEIFTVYKGQTMDNFKAYRKSTDPVPEKEKEGYFYRTVPAVIAWLEDLATERCDVQIIRLLRAMFDKPNRRPDAEHVWKVLTTCTTRNITFFCNPCCMPLVHDDPVLTNNSEIHPSKASYDSELPTTKDEGLSTDLYFRKLYSKDLQLDLCWVRNLRHWGHSILDVVQHGKHPNLLARKRLQASKDVDLDASIYAKTEAEILRIVQHRHIVKLHDTYLHGDIHTLLFEPAADHDLRSYLELAELKYQRKQPLTKDFDFLTRSFGCLANALACLHRVGYDHNDIRPENILVHDLTHESRIFLSKFSFGLRLEGGTSASGANPSQPWRFIDKITGKLRLRWSAQNEPVPKSKSQKMPMGLYRPPGLVATSVGQPKADVFALGCIFLEMCTVLCGRKVRDFEAYRADSGGDIAYCNTLPKAFEWLVELNMEGFEGKEKLHGIIKRMTDPDETRRPNALEVSTTLRQCKNSNGTSFIGNCAA